MRITAELAKPIGERLMSLLPYNINIMNERGKIVASGDKERLGQQHDGAIQVLLTKREVVLSEEDVAHLAGTKAGVNLPIAFENQIIGVVGITGKPQEVYHYAHLVKMTIEVLLEQVNIRSQLHYRQNALRTWVTELVQQEPLNDSRLQSLAESLEIETGQARTFVLIQVIQPTTFTWDELEIQALQNHLQGDVICSSIHSDLLFLATTQEYKELFPAIQRILSSYQRRQIELRMGVGKQQSGLSGYRSSYLQAQQSLQLQKILKVPDPIYIEDWGLLRFIDAIPIAIRKEFLATYLPQSLQMDENYWLTLQTFLESNRNVTESCKKLHIHRNTLIYRLQRIHEIIGLNPREFQDAVFLHVLLLCQKCTPQR